MLAPRDRLACINIRSSAITTQSLVPSPKDESIIQAVLDSLDDDKAVDIVTIPLGKKSSIADMMIIASGSSARQLMAMADHLIRRLKDMGTTPLGLEGEGTGDWILIDLGDVIIHLFRPEVREFYQLEKMWGSFSADDHITISTTQ